MAAPLARSGEIIDARPLGAALRDAKTTTLVATDHLKVMRLVVPAGKEIPPHAAPGEITVQCLEGRVEFMVGEKPHELAAGDLLHVSAAALHSLKGIQDASLLVTLVLSKNRPRSQIDAG